MLLGNLSGNFLNPHVVAGRRGDRKFRQRRLERLRLIDLFAKFPFSQNRSVTSAASFALDAFPSSDTVLPAKDVHPGLRLTTAAIQLRVWVVPDPLPQRPAFPLEFLPVQRR